MTASIRAGTANDAYLGVNGVDLAKLDTTNGLTLITKPLAFASGGTGDTGSAWLSFQSNPFPQGGGFGDATGVTYYKKMGRTVWFYTYLQINNVGSASGSLYFNLPFPYANIGVCTGRENYSTGRTLAGMMSSPGTQQVAVFNYDNSIPLGVAKLALSGVYEATA
ncbi:hypothetical protein QTI51_09630 [Variovorax sp. J22G73]|uniref:hypothetical protein n=1 Tax=unclassified Variovorax TaxID=663243 RepID=UPI0025777F06|nr:MULTISPECIES: hypothetical protein [unclassified Variovorax]MDM0006440.1 hypothetical protein [Variovorax sp. J22R203]MDM0097537.1 hypothetical protein [Variovorax sp. J22G73]